MNLAELIKIDSLDSEVNQINEYLDILKNYSHIASPDVDINKVRARLGIYLIKVNSELKTLLEDLGLGVLVE